jgi:hypothetical protein
VIRAEGRLPSPKQGGRLLGYIFSDSGLFIYSKIECSANLLLEFISRTDDKLKQDRGNVAVLLTKCSALHSKT